ncbi:MAG: hypothetical protein ACKOU6_12765 [Planctomycetota bacterium]
MRGAKKLIEVKAIDPFHEHDADTMTVEKIMNVEEVIMLHLGDTPCHSRHAFHIRRVSIGALEAGWREYFQGDGNGEMIGAAEFREVDAALTAAAEQFQEWKMNGGIESAAVDNRVIGAD